MDVRRVLGKLQPLMPDRVNTWARVLEQADSELRTLVEHEILAIARSQLGDFRGRILLSLPNAKRIQGRIKLGGVVYDKERWPAGLSESELLQNAAVFGRSGAGKTNVALHLLMQLSDRKVPFLFLDWKRTVRHAVPHFRFKPRIFTPGRSASQLRFNPFELPPGLEPSVYANLTTDTLAEAFTLGEGAKSLVFHALLAAFRDTNAPTVRDILKKVESNPDKERVRGWKTSAIRALSILEAAGIGVDRGTAGDHALRTLLSSGTILELDGLSQSMKKFLVPILCLWIYYSRLAAKTRETLQFVIFVEEAHHVLHRRSGNAGESVMEMLFRQCRELGIAMIAVDQHPSLISSSVLGNVYTSVCMNLRNPADVRKAADASGLEESERKWLSELPVGYGIVRLQGRWHRPFLVRFPHLPIQKGAVTDQRLQGLTDGRGALSGSERARMGRSGRLTGSRVPDHPLDEDSLAFLQDAVENPSDGVDARYKRLGFSIDKGNRIKSCLIAAGILEAESIRVGNTRKVMLRRTRATNRWLPANLVYQRAETARRESISHSYWKNEYLRRFRKMGYAVRLEAPRRGGRADVLATKNGETVAIEIETGLSDVARNVRLDLLSGFSRVIVVATTESALRACETRLAKSGLLIPSRIELRLAA